MSALKRQREEEVPDRMTASIDDRRSPAEVTRRCAGFAHLLQQSCYEHNDLDHNLTRYTKEQSATLKTASRRLQPCNPAVLLPAVHNRQPHPALPLRAGRLRAPLLPPPLQPGHLLHVPVHRPGHHSSPDDLIEYHVGDAEPVDPSSSTKGYSERHIHSEVYKGHPSVQAAVHSHSEAVVPTISGVPLRPCYHMAGFLRAEGVLVYEISEHWRGGEGTRGTCWSATKGWVPRWRRISMMESR